ncbi:MAG: hypothetical protein H6815_01435 [Phycisphaeraceae bacterium]|nr:hypothetical protein [Phycisphaerales bacterium]MCB9859089.1 hypothetical protein [Phycisphaeraceae bacterium]
MASIESYWDLLRACAGDYPPEAFEFVRQGLSHTAEMVHGTNASSEEDADDPSIDLLSSDEEASRHVSGQQLCMGLRDFALKRYGLLARTVMSKWGVNRTEDFGNIVFAMIDAGLMRKSDQDTVTDFRAVFDFDEAFGPNDSVYKRGENTQQTPKASN